MWFTNVAYVPWGILVAIIGGVTLGDGRMVSAHETITVAPNPEVKSDVIREPVEVASVLPPFTGSVDSDFTRASDTDTLQLVQYRSGRFYRAPYRVYRPRYNRFPYRRYVYPAPRIYGGYYNTPGYGYYGPGWQRGGVQLGRLNVWW